MDVFLPMTLNWHSDQGEADTTGTVMTSAAFLEILCKEFPGFRTVPKSKSLLSRVIHVFLLTITCGKQRRYMSHYHTVIGLTLYTPACWEETEDLDRLILLRHERIHLKQRRRYTFLGMALLYLLPILPLGLAWGRARIEWEAYVETLRATAEYRGIEAARAPWLRNEIVRRFVSADYGWMWPFPRQVNRWIDRTLDEMEAEHRPTNQRTL